MLCLFSILLFPLFVLSNYVCAYSVCYLCFLSRRKKDQFPTYEYYLYAFNSTFISSISEYCHEKVQRKHERTLVIIHIKIPCITCTMYIHAYCGSLDFQMRVPKFKIDFFSRSVSMVHQLVVINTPSQRIYK